MATAVGMALAEGRLTLEDRLADYFPEYVPEDPDPRLLQITLRDLLTMSSGFGHAYLMGEDRRKGVGFPDYLTYMMHLPMEQTPGTAFEYSTADSILAGRMVEKAVDENLAAYLYPRLFRKLEQGWPQWENDPMGHPIGGGGMYMRLTDMMKLGQLYLADGKWKGERSSGFPLGAGGHRQADRDSADGSGGYLEMRLRISVLALALSGCIPGGRSLRADHDGVPEGRSGGRCAVSGMGRFCKSQTCAAYRIFLAAVTNLRQEWKRNCYDGTKKRKRYRAKSFLITPAAFPERWFINMKFTKMQGIGNDYVYVNCLEETVEHPVETAKIVSDRHFGIGSDGLILICPSDQADFRMVMYNADGSEGAMCGNGIRCVGKYVYDYGLTDKTHLSIETKSGIKYLDLTVEDKKAVKIRVNMGKPDAARNISRF